jgi:uncharacterized protein YndB with AHSA1/START domain
MTVRPHRYRLFIKATPEQVWQGITDPDFTEQYFHETRFESSLEPGSGHRYVWNGDDQVVGDVVEADPPKRLVVTWRALYRADLAAEPPSRVEWTLTPAGEGMTRLDVVHGDLARSPLTWDSVRYGWVWILDSLKTLLETGSALPDEPAESADGDGDAPAAAAEIAGDWHRTQGIDANNSIWELLGQPDRSPAENEELLRRAYAAAYHWSRATGSGPENEARALYMIGRAQLAVGHGDLALEYGDECLAQCNEFGLVDFDLAYAHELRARGLHAVGRTDEAEAELARARAVPIADPADHEILDADLAIPFA